MHRLEATTVAVYRFIETYWRENQFAPSQREIALACYLSPAGVLPHLDKLEQAGYISRELNKPRTVRIRKPLPQTPGTAELIYQFIVERIHQGESPSQKEIAEAFDLSEQTVRTYLDELEETGHIQRQKRVSRSITLPEK
jgi:DNA-binding MarR family transcriptional regulator